MWKGIAIFGIWTAVAITAGFSGSPNAIGVVVIAATFSTLFVAGN